MILCVYIFLVKLRDLLGIINGKHIGRYQQKVSVYSLAMNSTMLVSEIVIIDSTRKIFQWNEPTPTTDSVNEISSDDSSTSKHHVHNQSGAAMDEKIEGVMKAMTKAMTKPLTEAIERATKDLIAIVNANPQHEQASTSKSRCVFVSFPLDNLFLVCFSVYFMFDFKNLIFSDQWISIIKTHSINQSINFMTKGHPRLAKNNNKTIKTTTVEQYEVFGWQPKVKQSDLIKIWAPYLVAVHKQRIPIGYAMFRFNMDYDNRCNHIFQRIGIWRWQHIVAVNSGYQILSKLLLCIRQEWWIKTKCRFNFKCFL